MKGIYKIENIKNGKIYIGSSIDIEKRIKRHKNELIKNNHVNKHLQRDFNKHGLESFMFECIEICNDNIKELEQKYLDEIFSNESDINYYNIGREASGGDNISNNPNRSNIIDNIKNGLLKKYENETDIERNDRVKRVTGDLNPNFGKKWTIEKKERMSKQRKGLKSKIKGKTYEEIHGEYKAKKLKDDSSKRMKNNLTGEKNGFFGKVHTEENLKLFSESQKNKPSKGMSSRLKPFYVDNIIYLTLNEASKKLGINYLTIRNRLISKNFTNYYYIEDIEMINKLTEVYLNMDTI